MLSKSLKDPEALQIAFAKASEQAIIARATQQLNLQNRMRLLDRDVSRALRLGKARIDNLDDLEKRVQKMRQQLREPSQTSAAEEVNMDLRRNNKVQIDAHFTVCARCQRRIRTNCFNAHDYACAQRQGKAEERPPIYDVKQDIKTEITTFIPQPPRNIKMKAKGSTFISWEWEPSVFDGGLPVTDYEISYSLKSSELDRLTGKYVFRSDSIPSLRTSTWCRESPICHRGFKIVNLRAATEYGDFQIRCCNLRGWSGWAPMLGNDPGDAKSKLLGPQLTVRTDDPDPPSPPMYVRCTEITSSCLYLDWQYPFYDGGSEIAEYIVHYTVLERRTTVTASNVVIESVRKLRVRDAATKVILRNIPPDTDIVNIYIKALNKVGLFSDEGKLTHGPRGATAGSLRTKKSSRREEIIKMIQKVEASGEAFFDTDFYSGVQQRLNARDFVEHLSRELEITPVDRREKREAEEWAEIQETRRQKKLAEEEEKRRKQEEDESDLTLKTGRSTSRSLTSLTTGRSDPGDELDPLTDFVFPIFQRRAHYKYRLKLLEKRVQSLTEERYQIDTDRSKMTMMMQTWQQLQMDYRLERDRVLNFNGSIVTSSLLHGASMQYQKEDFLIKITQAHDKCVGDIAAAKFKIIENENRKVRIKVLLKDSEDELKDRNGAFLDFNKTQERRIKAMNMIKRAKQGESDEAIKMKHLHKWLSFLEDKKALRLSIQALIRGAETRYFRNAFAKWKSGNFLVEKPPVFSLGGQLLEKAGQQRAELQWGLREIVAGTVALRQKFKLAGMNPGARKAILTSESLSSMEEGFNYLQLFDQGMHYLFEGDGYAQATNFEGARRAYENQILLLRSRPELDIKMLSLCHGRLGRMFMVQKKFDRAIVDFDRQLSLAREIEDNPETADAYFGLGSGYLMRFDFENAIRYLNLAQTKLASLGNLTKNCEALRSLKECYNRIGRADVASQYDEKIDRIEGEMKNKMGKIDSSLTDLKGRLIIGSSASLEFVVNIERTTLRAIRLRNHIDAKNGDLAENEALLEAQEEACKKIEDLLTAIQKEIDAAYETDEFEMISYLVHETPQMVDIEELKTRLAGRKDEELFNYKTEKAEEARIKTVIGNLKDDVNIASDELDLEEVALMKKSRLDRPFRCVEFCPTNVAGNEVTGTATGGVEWFIAAEGPNIHCIDYHSGEILTVIVGGDKANKDKANARDKEYNLDKDTGNEKDEAVGHTGIVTCLLHDGHLLFSGSIDETIICWDARTKKRITTMVGHEGSIVALAVEDIRLASASADATIRIWDKISGEQLRVVYGHSKSVLSMQMGEMWMLTGSADEDVRVWSIERAGKRSLSVKCKHRLVGHETPVTCVRYGRLEVISGDSLGRIFIWWMETGEVIRKCEVHKGPVKCMQFDSCHIVSGGADSNLCVTDIATGDVMTTLRGHEKGHVLSLAFDSERIISVGADNTLRYWQWGKKSGPLDKFHVLDKGQTLIAVSKIYNVSVAEIMAWNGIIEMRHCYPGMKLIVKKGNPDMPTMAEKIAQEKAYRREGAGGLAGQHSKADAALEKKAGTGLIKALKFDRVKRQANNWDRNSLGNRMFLKEKKDHELFPNSIDIQGNGGNLAGRLRRQKAALIGQQQGQSIESDDPPARFFIHKENEDQWGPVADSLGTAMLNMLMEYSLYAVVAEVKDDLIDKRSVQGRIVAIQRMEAKLAAMAAANAASISEQPDATATALTSAADAKDSVTAVAATDSPSAVVGSAIGGIEVRDQKSRASRRRASKNRAHSAASASDSSTAHSKKHSSGTAEANSVPDVNNTGTALVHADAAIGANMNVIPTADSDTDAEAGAIHSVTDDANDQSSASPPHSNHRRRKDKSKSRGKARSKSRGKSQTRSKRRHERRQSQSPSQSPEASSVNSNVKVNFNVDVEGHTGVIGNETVPINVDESPGSNDDVIRRLVLPPIPGAAERS